MVGGGVWVGVGEGVPVFVGEGEGVLVGVGEGVFVDVGVGEGVPVGEGVGVGVTAPLKKPEMTCPRLSMGAGRPSSYMNVELISSTPTLPV